MNFSQAKNMTVTSIPRMLALLICVGLMVISAAAQKGFAPDVSSFDLDQCANGSSGILQCAGNQWQNGNLNGNQALYVEGESVPYRAKITGFTPNSTGNTITLEYDTTESSAKHAIDYLTTFSRSVGTSPNHTGQPAALPCDNAGFACVAPTTTSAIPIDPNVTAAGVTQIGGQFFTMYGGTITAVSGYTRSGTYAGASQTSLTLTFTAGSTGNMVLAWGGHISTRNDWGLNNSAVGLSGSPYHMRIITGGNQDRSLSVDAVIYPASVRIIKRVYTLDQFTPFASTFSFGFTSGGSGGAAFPANFNLIDNDTTEAGGGSVLNSNVLVFGAANGTININENQILSGRFVPSPTMPTTCTELNGGVPPVLNTMVVNNRQVTIVPDEGEIITCTFTNVEQVTTAANASISGRVTSSFGRGISGVRVTVSNPGSGETYTTSTNSFGYYTINDLQAGEFYFVTVASKRYSFSNDTRALSLNESVADVDFASDPE